MAANRHRSQSDVCFDLRYPFMAQQTVGNARASHASGTAVPGEHEDNYDDDEPDRRKSKKTVSSRKGEKKVTRTAFRDAKPVNSPPRPPNAWILYRSDKMREMQQMQAKVEQASASTSRGRRSSKKVPVVITPPANRAQPEVSKLVSQMWKEESDSVRLHYTKLAQEQKRLHQSRYPDYKYQPRRRIATKGETDSHSSTRSGQSKATTEPKINPFLPNASLSRISGQERLIASPNGNVNGADDDVEGQLDGFDDPVMNVDLMQLQSCNMVVPEGAVRSEAVAGLKPEEKDCRDCDSVVQGVNRRGGARKAVEHVSPAKRKRDGGRGNRKSDMAMIQTETDSSHHFGHPTTYLGSFTAVSEPGYSPLSGNDWHFDSFAPHAAVDGADATGYGRHPMATHPEWPTIQPPSGVFQGPHSAPATDSIAHRGFFGAFHCAPSDDHQNSGGSEGQGHPFLHRFSSLEKMKDFHAQEVMPLFVEEKVKVSCEQRQDAERGEANSSSMNGSCFQFYNGQPPMSATLDDHTALTAMPMMRTAQSDSLGAHTTSIPDDAESSATNSLVNAIASWSPGFVSHSSAEATDRLSTSPSEQFASPLNVFQLDVVGASTNVEGQPSHEEQPPSLMHLSPQHPFYHLSTTSTLGGPTGATTSAPHRVEEPAPSEQFIPLFEQGGLRQGQAPPWLQHAHLNNDSTLCQQFHRLV